MDELLSEAIAPVLRDLLSTGLAAPRVEDRGWNDDPDVVSAMLWSPDGTGMGVYVSRSVSDLERVVMVSDQVQEWAIEELWTQGSNWPPCPIHPNNHPMRVAIGADVAEWTCPEGQVPIAEIGAL